MSLASTDRLPATGAPSDDMLSVRGARTHNLKNIDVDIPRGQMVVVTGPSGSGKSSLAFDTIYAEGQRQYIESLSVYARQFVNQLERPDVDSITGLQPTICIDQRVGAPNPRSTVATSTEIYDFLRLLLARVGEVSCHQCGLPVRPQSAEQIEEGLMQLAEGTKVVLLAPMVRGRKGAHAEVLSEIRKAGLVRVRVDGEVHDLDNVPPLNARRTHSIEAVVDRLVIRSGTRPRLAESLQLALRNGDGVVIASVQQAGGEWVDQLFSTLYACPNCYLSLAEIEPRTFSFNSPYGACPQCDGLGVRLEFDPELVLPNLQTSLTGNAVAPWKGIKNPTVKAQRSAATQFLESRGAAADTPLSELKPAVFDQLLRGDEKQFPGLLTMLEKELATATDETRQTQLTGYRGQVVCSACAGARLRPEALGVRVGGQNIFELVQLCVADAAEWFAELSFTGQDAEIAHPIVTEIAKRLGFLKKVGLGYLTLDRAVDTLSGGEFQRIRLASGIGSGLAGICYILDEPSIGLHARDNDRLIEALRELQQNDSTVLVVEHDEAMMRQADRVIDMGPGAGIGGGEITSQGTPAEVAADPQSLTGAYLAGRRKIEAPTQRRPVVPARAIVIEGASSNNLKDVSVAFPLGVLTAVTGVSGSGKSSLVNETLARAIARKLGGVAPRPGAFTSLRGVQQIDKLIEIDQSPLGRSPRSNAATYTGAFELIRKLFAATKEAKQLGFGLSRFSFNVAGGRCEQCLGQGMQRLEMKFLPDLFVPCSQCGGARFNQQTLQVKYRGLSIADVLALPIAEAVSFFENYEQLHRIVRSLNDVGLGYLSLGQASTTLSGGESQRVKLATELARNDTGQTFYLLDEPTTGLHFEDIRLLLKVLQKLVDRGNTVLVIEHNLDVVKSADWVIDLGPEGGAAGGTIVATGTPEELAENNQSLTGQYLRSQLSGSTQGNV